MDWPLLAGLAPEKVREVVAASRRRKFKRGEVIFHEGDPGDTLHLIAAGHVAVRVTTPMGETATLRVIGPGGFFGELAVWSPGPRNATVVALETAETLALGRDQITRFRQESPDVERALLEALIHEVRRLSTQLVDAMYLPTNTRLVRRLVELAQSYPADRGGRVVIPLTQDDLAGLSGTTRPTTNQLLAKLVDKGLVELGRGRVVVLDLNGLIRQAR